MRRIVQTRPLAFKTNGAKKLRVGFVPLCDCAPLVVAAEAGLFRKHGLDAVLVREVGWATMLDKICYSQLEAAHALAALPFAATLGLGSPACGCVTGLVLNLQGNAISLDIRYHKEGVRDAKGFGEWIRRNKPTVPLVFGVVSPVSTHRFLMERWLAGAGLTAGRDYELAVVPPSHVPQMMQAGHLAGFCVGEPWNSVAIERGLVWSVATSADLAPGHVEKVVCVTDQFATQRLEEHQRLIAALLEACIFCADPANHAGLSELLAQREYVGAPADLIQRSFSGAFLHGPGSPKYCPEFTIYHRGDSNAPTFDRGRWVLKNLVGGVGPTDQAQRDSLIRRVFRGDLFEAVSAGCHATSDPTLLEPNPEHETDAVYRNEQSINHATSYTNVT